MPVFGWAVKRIPRAYLLPVVYGFLIANLIGILIAFAAGITKYSAGAFIIWLSGFNLFVVSHFWSRVNDTFSTGQSHRLYGYIAAGGTVGALSVQMPGTRKIVLSKGLRMALSSVPAIDFAGLALTGFLPRQRRRFFLDCIGVAGRRFERHLLGRPSRGRTLVFHRIPDRGAP